MLIKFNQRSIIKKKRSFSLTSLSSGDSEFYERRRTSRHGKTIRVHTLKRKISWKKQSLFARTRRSVIFISFDWNNSGCWLANSSLFSAASFDVYALRFEKFSTSKFLLRFFIRIVRRARLVDPRRTRHKMQMHFCCAVLRIATDARDTFANVRF